MTHYGRDFSSFQGDLSPADCAGIEFAYVKATQGSGYVNPFAPQQVKALRAAGVHVGLYHFLDVNASLGDQLHNFATYAQSLGGSSLPPAQDSETLDPAGWPALATLMSNFAVGVEAWGEPVPNTKSVVYVNLSFDESLPGFPWGRSVWLADPNAGAPHRPCLILQTAPRPVSSADLKNVDPDVFMGTEAEWGAFIGQPATAEPAPLPDNAVEGPAGLEVSVIGLMKNSSGLYFGRAANSGITVYAGLGSPTVWEKDFNPKVLPEGTPLAVALTDLSHVSESSGYEQL